MTIERNIAHGPYQRKTLASVDTTKPKRKLGSGWTISGGVKTESYSFSHRIREKDITHERTFAAKKYHSEKMARESYRRYIFCREAGLPVPLTLGVDENDPRLLIASDLTCGGKFVVESANIHVSTIPPDPHISEIVRLSALAKEIARAGAAAAAKGIRLTGDTALFRIPSIGGRVSIDFAIGDFDNDYLMVNGADRSQPLGLRNAEVILDAFVRWVRKWPAGRLSNASAESLRTEIILAATMRMEFPKAYALAAQLPVGGASRITHDRITEMRWGKRKTPRK